MSESLDTLDERWKAGAFRYLMPDFRARVHRGETFVIAGDRFAIGSSREMSPAGLKAIADEVGLEMVIVCGNNMGDIFRRNALNLGLQVVQSPGGGRRRERRRRVQLRAAVAAADERDAGQDLRPGAAQREGRRDPPDRRHLRGRPPRVQGGRSRRRRASSGRIEQQARRMTSTEQIVWAHRVDKIGRGRARRDAARLRRPAAGVGRHRAVFDPHLQPDHRRQHDLSAPGGDRQRSLRLHRQGRRRQADGDRAGVRAAARHREAVLRDAGRRHLPFLLSRAGAGHAGAVHSRRRLAQPRLRRVRRGRHGRRIDDARVRLVDRLHLLHARRRRGASSSAASCSRGSAARTSSSSCCGGGARSSRRGCRSSSSTRTSSCRSPIATRSRT